MNLYTLRHLSVHYGPVTALRETSIEFGAGQLVSIAGPNGAGKTTLLNVMAGLGSFEGTCLLLEKDIRKWPRRVLAQRVSVVPQSVRIDFPFSAEQVVLMGRTPFADAMFESADDLAHVERAMELTGTLQFRHRDFRSLSGGEKQRVILASALAQTPEVLLLDEPTTWLDLQHQISLYKLLRRLAHDGVLVITITHDLNLAATFADRLVLLRAGELAGDGHPSHVLHSETVRDVFQVESVVESRSDGRPWIQYDQ